MGQCLRDCNVGTRPVFRSGTNSESKAIVPKTAQLSENHLQKTLLTKTDAIPSLNRELPPATRSSINSLAFC